MVLHLVLGHGEVVGLQVVVDTGVGPGHLLATARAPGAEEGVAQYKCIYIIPAL